MRPREIGPEFTATTPGMSRVVATMTILGAALGYAASAEDPTILATNIAAVRTGLNLSRSTGSFIASLATLTGGAAVLGAGALGDLYGKKRMYMYGLLGTVGFGLLAAAAPNGAVLIAGRAGVGVAFAFLVGLSLAIVNDSFPPGRRKIAIALYLTVGLAITAPLPAIGTWLAQQVGWRTCLLIAPMIAAIGLAITVRYVPETPRAMRHLDLAGLILIAVALLGVVYGILQLQNGFTARAWVPILVGLIAAAGFVYRELHTPEPALDLRIFRSKPFNAALIAGVAWNIVTGGSTILFAFYLVTVRGQSPEILGLQLIPALILQALTAVVSGRAAVHFGDRPILLTGLVVMVAGLLAVQLLGEHTSMLVLFLAVVLNAIGGAIIQTSHSTIMMANAPDKLAGAVSGVRAAFCGAGYSLGPALFAMVGTWLAAQERPRKLAEMDVTLGQALAAFDGSRGDAAAASRSSQLLGPERTGEVVQDAEQFVLHLIHNLSLIMTVVPILAIVAALVLLPRKLADR